jgi:chemotaxis protein methyltransferase CheR
VVVPSSELETVQIKLFLESLYLRYGYDFRGYAYPSIRRRILRLVELEGLKTISALQSRVLEDPACMERVLHALTIHVTAMYRDPDFYERFRIDVVPILRTYPFVRIWIAGCASGEEVYSLAILLHEENLYERCRIYGTDLSESVVQKAKLGVFPLAQMKDYTANYIRSGGKEDFSSYYTAQADGAIFRTWLRDNVVFAQHNLVTDGSPNEFNLIFCRNVMIYFTAELQAHVHRLFHASLTRLGILALGRRESLRFTPHENDYEPIDLKQRLYKKVS